MSRTLFYFVWSCALVTYPSRSSHVPPLIRPRAHSWSRVPFLIDYVPHIGMVTCPSCTPFGHVPTYLVTRSSSWSRAQLATCPSRSRTPLWLPVPTWGASRARPAGGHVPPRRREISDVTVTNDCIRRPGCVGFDGRVPEQSLIMRGLLRCATRIAPRWRRGTDSDDVCVYTRGRYHFRLPPHNGR